EAIGLLLPPGRATGLSLSAREGLSGTTPRGQPWTSAVTLPHRCNGLRARRMAVLYTLEYPVFLAAPPGAHQAQLLAILFEDRVITHPGPLPAAACGLTLAGCRAPER